MLIDLRTRKLAAVIILAVSIAFAVYFAIPGDGVGVPPEQQESSRIGWLVQLGDMLNRVELAHIAGHVLIFGGVGFLLGAWGAEGQRGSFWLAMRYVLIGGMLMEALQVIVGYSDDYVDDLILGTLFDLAVDMVAGATVAALVARYHAPLNAWLVKPRQSSPI